VIEYRIDRRSGVAAYVQIVRQTRQALLLGTLRGGDKLPTAREVVEATAINPNTVLKAYRELEHLGIVEARRGVGTFIRADAATGGAERIEEDSPLRGELDDWMRRARAAGVTADEVDALVQAARNTHYEEG
jgi:GntR family transcriptional regulator